MAEVGTLRAMTADDLTRAAFLPRLGQLLDGEPLDGPPEPSEKAPDEVTEAVIRAFPTRPDRAE